MQLIPFKHEVNDGLAKLNASGVPPLLTTAFGALQSPTQKVFTASFSRSLRSPTDGWSPEEFRYTTIQPSGAGRPRAIDFFHCPSKFGIELELSNKTCFSHDLLKLEVAFRAGLIAGGAVVTICVATARQLGWRHASNSSYLTYERAEEFLRIFAPALTVPIALIGF